MKKSHKLAIVRERDSRGFFTIRKVADLITQQLQVSRLPEPGRAREGEQGA